MTQHRLLLVEDDYDVAEMLLLYFKSKNYDVLHAGNGADGIDLARTRFPNLILLDVMLPDMNGYDICYQLRHMSMTKYIPTLFLTQKDERSSKVKGLELGADDYITKPFDIEELRLRVENAINRANREHLHEARSGLPTGPFIVEERSKRPDHHEMVFTLHHFDAYIDVYSFIAANDVLYHVGKIIRTVLTEMGLHDAFVGIQENDFIVFADPAKQTHLERAISERFQEKVTTFYTFSDAQRGGLLLTDDSGQTRTVPMMTLTTATTVPDTAPDNSDDQLPSTFDW